MANVIEDLIKEFVLTKNPYKKGSKTYLLKKGLAYLSYIPLTKFYQITRGHKTFKYQCRDYHYYYGLYNATFRNERAVEIPIIINQATRKVAYDINSISCRICLEMKDNILEIGNVLSHYYPVKHDIVDKYERGWNIINEDIATFKPKNKYDLVISISTLEHVGWDEKREEGKLIKTLKNIKSNILKPGGVLFATVPIGYNEYLDQLLKYEPDIFSSIHCMWRANHRSKNWIEITFDHHLIKDCVELDTEYHEVKDGYGSTLIAVLEMRNEKG